MGKLLLERFSTPEALAVRAAEKWLDRLAKAQGASHYVALSGGRISRVFFAASAERIRKREISLNRTHFFWADERCVPPNHDESNFLLAYDQLLGPTRVPDANVHRIRGEEPQEVAAQRASEEILRVVPRNADGLPVLDIVFLGMGEDGHVASLFPQSLINPLSGIYVPVMATKPPPERVTLTYAVIEAAKEAWVMVSGAGKEEALCDSIAPDGKTPLAQVIRKRSLTRVLTNI
jgi:6-phosphogluconolactonase